MSNKTLYVNNFLTWTATRFTWLNLVGVWTKAKVTWENNGGTWRAIQAALSVTCPAVSGSNSGFASSGLVQSSAANPTVTDAANALSYAWTHLSTSSGNTPSCSNAASATPTWQATVVDGVNSVSQWRLTVTDTVASATTTTTITCTLSWADLN